MKLRAISESFRPGADDEDFGPETMNGAEGEYVEELLEIGDGSARVHYTFSYSESGQHYPKTWDSPAEYPTIEIASLDSVEILSLVDEFDQPMPIRPEYIEIAKKHFWRNLARDLASQANSRY
jgi:hypothetical protein